MSLPRTLAVLSLIALAAPAQAQPGVWSDRGWTTAPGGYARSARAASTSREGKVQMVVTGVLGDTLNLATLDTDGVTTAGAQGNTGLAGLWDYKGQVVIGGITFNTSNKVEFKLTHSVDDSTYEAVAQADVKGVTVGTGGIVRSLVAAHAAASLTKVGYNGGRRYLKLLADFSGTHSAGTPISAVVVGGEPYIAPVA
jgi:hypothetical protein